MARNRLPAFGFWTMYGLAGAAVALALGCSGTPPTAPAAAVRGGTVRVWCGDDRFRAEFTPRLTTWANRNGATVQVESAAASADVLLLPPADLGARAAAGELLPLPESVTGGSAAFQWTGLLRVYQSLVRWGGTEYAVPLVGEGYVLVYRADRLADPALKKAFTEKAKREPLPIRTWDELAEVAAAFAPPGKPGLPPLPPADADALTAFARVAACYDRPSVKIATKERDATDYLRLGLSFLASAETGAPRLTAPAFAEAFRWFHATAPLRPKAPGDPLDAVVNESAVAAVLPLADVARLPRAGGAVDPKFGVAAVPGAGRYFDAKGNPQEVPAGNFVPYYGGGGLVGAVRTTAAQPEACWNLLAELGGPAGSGVTADAARIGSGPLRAAQAGEGGRQWRQYGFDEARTVELGKALDRYAAAGLQNPAVALRTPDQKEVTALIVKQVRRAASGEATAEEAVKQADADWKELDAKTPGAERKTWRRKAAGLE